MRLVEELTGKRHFRAALFDLDGVVFDTEPQYSMFWSGVFKRHYPDIDDAAQRIKGQTLTQIYDSYFSGREALQRDITAALDRFELDMEYPFITGVEAFIAELRSKGVKTAVVTSSNQAKMENVYRRHPAFKSMFDHVFTSENFTESKPSPCCYLLAARHFNVKPSDCVVFEDSFNGLKAGRSAGMYVVGLSTTNSEESIRRMCDMVVGDFSD